VKDKPTAEFLLEMGELVVDAMTTTDAVREIPVVGSAFKAVKAMDDIRSHLLARKIGKFLSEPGLVATVAALKASERIFEDPEHARAVGETLLMVLDKVTDLEKPVLLAKVYAAYLNGDIKQEMLMMIVHAIDISANIDLQMFIGNRAEIPSTSSEWKGRLVHAGLFKLGYASVQFGGAASASVTPIGQALKDIVRRNA